MTANDQGETPAQTWTWRGSKVSYTVRGHGLPLVLIHGFGAGASGFQWRRNVAALAAHATVYNLDLLGWGASERPRLRYDAALYTAQIGDFLAQVVQEPAVVVGCFQTAAYALALAAQQPECVRALVLQTPGGLNYLRNANLGGSLFFPLLFETPLGELFYQFISSDNGTRSFMRNYMYAQPQRVDDTMIRGFTAPARQPGGRWGAAAFLCGQLNLDVRPLLPRVQQPTLIIWGDRTSFVPSDEARAFTSRLPQARSVVIGPANIWLNDERADEWNQAVIGFLGTLTRGSAAAEA